MSSVWSKMEALAGDPAKFRKCSCDKSEHEGWTFDPAKEEVSHGFAPIKSLLHTSIERVHAMSDKRNPKKRGCESLLGLLEKNESYRVPPSAEEERRRFHKDISELCEHMYLLAAVEDGSGWPKRVRGMEKKAPADMMERLIWHHDPRLQLIHYPSFRLFIELQLLHRSIRVAQESFGPQLGTGEENFTKIYKLAVIGIESMFFYFFEEKMMESSPATPDSASEEEDEEDEKEEAEAGPSLTKAQRKHAKQKAKEEAKGEAKAKTTVFTDLPPLAGEPGDPPPAPEDDNASDEEFGDLDAFAFSCADELQRFHLA